LIKQHSRSAPIQDIKVTATPELVARGKDISDGLCGACHSKTGTLTGGYDPAVELLVPISGPLKGPTSQFGEYILPVRTVVSATART
jgi:hypothetical protein